MMRGVVVALLAMVIGSGAKRAQLPAEPWQRAPLAPFLGLPVAVDDECTGFPRLLSQTQLFADLAALRPIAGLAAYTVNQALWADGATKQRWLAVPNTGAPYGANARIAVDHEAAWRFPRGTVFVKHFALPQDLQKPDGPQRRLETRVLAVRHGGEVYGVTYRWRPDGSDAELLTDSATEDIATIDEAGKPTTVRWLYPSPSQCITCHTREAGGVLGVNTRQLNRLAADGKNQLVALATHDWLDRPVPDDQPAMLPRLYALDGADAELPTRIRSYLDANCAFCHQPGSRVGGAAFALDLRFVTPLAQQGLLDGEAHNALGIANGKVIAPHQPAQSVLLDRIARRGDPFAMPPIGSGRCDPTLLARLRQWIEGMPATK